MSIAGDDSSAIGSVETLNYTPNLCPIIRTRENWGAISLGTNLPTCDDEFDDAERARVQHAIT